MELDENANILMEREPSTATEPPSYSSSSKVPPLSPISVKENRRSSTNATASSSAEGNKVMSAEPIGRVYGSGLGYGLRTTLGVHGRADGVAVYLKRQATLVLGNILGPVVFGGGSLRSWEDRLIAMKKAKIDSSDNTNTTSTTSSATSNVLANVSKPTNINSATANNRNTPTTTTTNKHTSSSTSGSISRPPPLKCSDDSDIKFRSNRSTSIDASTNTINSASADIAKVRVRVSEESQKASISRLLEGSSSSKKGNNVEVFFTRTFIRYLYHCHCHYCHYCHYYE